MREEDIEEKARVIETKTKAEENEQDKIIEVEKGQDEIQENCQDETEGWTDESNKDKKVIEEKTLKKNKKRTS